MLEAGVLVSFRNWSLTMLRLKSKGGMCNVPLKYINIAQSHEIAIINTTCSLYDGCTFGLEQFGFVWCTED